jgi:hypothetical protein
MNRIVHHSEAVTCLPLKGRRGLEERLLSPLLLAGTDEFWLAESRRQSRRLKITHYVAEQMAEQTDVCEDRVLLTEGFGVWIVSRSLYFERSHERTKATSATHHATRRF